MKTYAPRPNDVERRWYVVDADGVVLGRLASEVAQILRGKHKPIFAPHADVGDHVIVVNASRVRLTGGKAPGREGPGRQGFDREERAREEVDREEVAGEAAHRAPDGVEGGRSRDRRDRGGRNRDARPRRRARQGDGEAIDDPSLEKEEGV